MGQNCVLGRVSPAHLAQCLNFCVPQIYVNQYKSKAKMDTTTKSKNRAA
ncbi:Uncharacterised protein [uncultured archaeon]|nr:Uncharacterised protein [uncultured archaeon]